MDIRPFAVEEWMNEWETGAKYNIAETCADSISLDQIFELTGADRELFFKELASRRLTYGDITGAPAFKEGICGLYRTIRPEHVVPTHGAAGANHHVFLSLLAPGDRVVSVMPTYQQLYSIPDSLGAETDVLLLKRENGYLPDLDELRRLVTPDTKMICINNPNNPTGALMETDMLKRILEIADRVGAWVLCDEVYRHLTQTDEWCESAADLYERGISVSSMSKVFSLAGLRLGWIACRDKEAVRSFLSHRDYNLISCGMLDEMTAALALKYRDRLLARNRGIIRENLALLDQWVQREPGIHYVKPQAGTTALLHYDLDIPSYSFCEEMYRETGAFVTPGDCFEEPGCFRLGYACDKQTLLGGLNAIHEFMERKVRAASGM
ncbi:MAG: aminotransferase [Lachnospiraceae bacterium]|nr:aminotransferase [Lachnospiraceae bacterium]